MSVNVWYQQDSVWFSLKRLLSRPTSSPTVGRGARKPGVLRGGGEALGESMCFGEASLLMCPAQREAAVHCRRVSRSSLELIVEAAAECSSSDASRADYVGPARE